MPYVSGAVSTGTLHTTIESALAGQSWTTPTASVRISPNSKMRVVIGAGSTGWVTAGVGYGSTSANSSTFGLHHQTIDPAGTPSYFLSTSTNSFFLTVAAPTTGTGSPGGHAADSMGVFRVQNYANNNEAWLILGFPTQQGTATASSVVARFTSVAFDSPTAEQPNTGAFYWSAATGMVPAQLMAIGSPSPYATSVAGIANPTRHASGAPLLQQYVVSTADGVVGRARDIYLLHNQYGTPSPLSLTGDVLPVQGDVYFVNGVAHRVHTPYGSMINLSNRGRTPLCPLQDYTEKRPHILVRSA